MALRSSKPVDGLKPVRSVWGRSEMIGPSSKRADANDWDIFGAVLVRVLDKCNSASEGWPRRAVLLKPGGGKVYVKEDGITSLSVERVRYMGLGPMMLRTGNLVKDINFDPGIENVEVEATFTPDHLLNRSVRLLRTASQADLFDAAHLITDLARDHQRLDEAVPFDHENEAYGDF